MSMLCGGSGSVRAQQAEAVAPGSTSQPPEVNTAQRHYAVVRRPDLGQPDLGSFFASFFGLGVQSARGGDYEASPSFDASPPVDTSSASTDAQAASDAEVQAIQQLNDENALNASMAAAEQQNDAANAATLQTEINAGM